MRVKAAEGVWIDFYNLHADAGLDAGDITTRAKNLAQLSTYIAKWSPGMPIVVMGDTNARYTRTGDRGSLDTFAFNTRTTDAWLSLIRMGSIPTTELVCPFPFPPGTPGTPGTPQETQSACEVTDKFFSRSSTAIMLTPSSYVTESDTFLSPAGYPLVGYYPQRVTYTWMLSDSIRMGDPPGGQSGDPYNDIPSVLTGKSVPKLTSFTLRSGNRIDAFSYTVAYPSGSTATVSHGGTGGLARTLTLNVVRGERITSVVACSGTLVTRVRVFYLKLTTNEGRTLEGGVVTPDCVTLVVPTDAGSGGQWGLVATWGRSGDEIDRFRPIWGSSY